MVSQEKEDKNEEVIFDINIIFNGDGSSSLCLSL